ncbi:DUF190 domain-containing protein [Oceanidesulfovibrio marinus]|uniref:DUF190 domain-containing protein n=1 Tax=Oceanidesulfovibrio marinus TaxID=370038 RepID=A0A6P1ZK95_9BACT|nr:DUF190 domain-containing protein [Oceanidesulfovibrio marinus]QJT08284.1 DUF190 domain-containing protein [Oceanidesulfovibrio marinus]TVM35175.1 DUF190 domain-containing protein [Oceanidesulfovibrio marinus]
MKEPTIPSEAKRLICYIGEADRHKGRALYEVIVEAARREGLAGATVFRGLSGFGAHSLVHTASILRLSEDLPMRIEIVDEESKIEAFVPILHELMQGGLVTIDSVRVLSYRHKDSPS